MHVILVKPHTHAGREHPAGAALDVPHSVAVWLIEQGVATAFSPSPLRGEGRGEGDIPRRKPRSNPVQTARKEG